MKTYLKSAHCFHASCRPTAWTVLAIMSWGWDSLCIGTVDPLCWPFEDDSTFWWVSKLTSKRWLIPNSWIPALTSRFKCKLKDQIIIKRLILSSTHHLQQSIIALIVQTVTDWQRNSLSCSQNFKRSIICLVTS